MMEALILLWHLILKGENYQYYQRWLFLSVIGETYMFEQGEYIWDSYFFFSMAKCITYDYNHSFVLNGKRDYGKGN